MLKKRNLGNMKYANKFRIIRFTTKEKKKFFYERPRLLAHPSYVDKSATFIYRT